MQEKIIEINNLIKQYNATSVKAVDDISFYVNKGELFAFLGVNGAGKSTTINILCTLLTKTSGKVQVCGFDIKKDSEKVRENIGIVFQNGVLDEKLSVYDNLHIRGAFFHIDKKTVDKRIKNLSNRLNMNDFIKMPYEKLSGGQKRKSDIARALISNPQILFLDEPTTGLDPQSRMDMWQVIKDIREQYKTTIFLTTHYMEEVNDADRVAIIDKGKIICIDTPENLKSKYSKDIVKLTVDLNNKDAKACVEKALISQQVAFDFSVDTFIIHINNGINLIDTIYNLKNHLTSIEIIKGDMDNVFLNVVGRRFENE